MILLAWPSQGYSDTVKRQCGVNPGTVRILLANWATQLNRSTHDNPGPVVATYGANAVLLPTCANGPLTGVEITGYFTHFLESDPKVQLDTSGARIGGDCNYAFASGLYAFRLNDGSTLRARYTYIFSHGKIVQHHSSLEPQSRDGTPRSLCKEKPE
jgi:hypothetical protein